MNLDYPQRRMIANNIFLTSYPRYLMESVGIVFIACVSYILYSKTNSEISAIPLLGSIALGTQRLLPLFQLVYSSWAIVSSFNADVASVFSLLQLPLIDNSNNSFSSTLKFTSLELDNVSFKYQASKFPIISNANLHIVKGDRIGIIGPTGSGKSTFVDLILGFLVPTTGNILFNNQSIHNSDSEEYLNCWRGVIGHVPQQINLVDGTILQNIALGVDEDKIDFERVKFAAKQAQIASFIESIPDNYLSYVGERGIRLSGGQIQRIGIARALYKQPQVLFFDEGTSALDVVVEKELMSAIDQLSDDLTIIMIAHRLTTLKNCNKIFSIKNAMINQVDMLQGYL